MNNPFYRLKHYLPNKIDSRENHATECLAACLVFSPRIRTTFIQFLLNTSIKDSDLAGVEVVTQEPIEDGGWIDLVLRQQGKLLIAVEVKVGSPENRDHHRKQLQSYKSWLDRQSEPEKHLFTLVRNPDKTFLPWDYGADKDGRRTLGGIARQISWNVKGT